MKALKYSEDRAHEASTTATVVHPVLLGAEGEMKLALAHSQGGWSKHRNAER